MRITTIGDPVLREPAAEVGLDELLAPETQQLIEALIDTRREAGGAGLAAPQVGVSKRIAVVEVDDATRYAYKPLVPLTVLVNPVVEPLGEETLLLNEGCLSVPDLRGDVPRHLRVRVHYFDRNGEPCMQEVDGLTAGTFQHEVDHLDGILFVDQLVDTRSLSTWEQFARHGEREFLARVAPYTRR
jgi:peptide deformylase